jgi:hypothetical protein
MVNRLTGLWNTKAYHFDGRFEVFSASKADKIFTGYQLFPSSGDDGHSDVP